MMRFAARRYQLTLECVSYSLCNIAERIKLLVRYWSDRGLLQSRWQRRGKRSRTLIKKCIFFIQRCHILASAYCMWAVFSSNLNQLPLGCQLSNTQILVISREFYAVVTFHLVRVDPSRTTILKLNVAVWLWLFSLQWCAQKLKNGFFV